MDITLLENLFLTPEGLISLNDGRLNDRDQRVHFRQGDLDGACGIYALMSALVAGGALTRRDVLGIWDNTPDYRTKFGKSIVDIEALTQNGLDDREIIKIFNGIKSLKIFERKATLRNFDAEIIDIKGKETKLVIEDALGENMPCILRLDWEGGGAHWVTTIGRQSFIGEVENFLTLDPGANYDKFTAWNGILRCTSKPGPRPYLYWGNGIEKTYCSISMGLRFKYL